MSGSILAKPQLRRLGQSSLKKHFIIATIFTVVSTVAYRVFLVDARRNKYAEYHRHYDENVDFERMKKAGVFKSVLPNGEVGEGW